jgi:6-phosphofructo-2-kinase
LSSLIHQSYADVVERLAPVILELEGYPADLLLMTHSAVVRALEAYLTGKALDDVPNCESPLHTVLRCRPRPYGTEIVRYRWNEVTDEFDKIA